MTGEAGGDRLLESLLADGSLLADSALPVVIYDLDGAVIEANQAFADLVGHALAEVNQLQAAQILHPHDRASSEADTADLIAGRRKTIVAERRGVTKDGATVWARVHKTVVDRGGQPAVAAIIADVTHHRARVAELEHAAHHDELTGVLNRRGLLAHLSALGPTRGPLLVVMVDVNGLKAVNDTLGHRAGDLLLQAVATSLRTLDPELVVARLAGDEFVLLTRSHPVAELDDMIRAAVAVPTTLGADVTVVPSIAVGSAVLPAGEPLAAALHAADLAMYEDKRVHNGAGRQSDPTVTAYTRATGALLRRARTNLGLTLRQAHRRSGERWTAPLLDSFERGEGSLTVDTLIDLAELYGVTPAALLPSREEQTG
ncbi:MAG: diguanylate cyclase [Mycobacteriaceae bacterium]